MNVNQILDIQLDNVGQRLFSEVCSSYYKQPCNALKFNYNVTHGEFSCEAGEAIGMYYLNSNSTDRRWAIQYIDTVAYGPNPGATHIRLIELLTERAQSKIADINSVAFNNSRAEWTEYVFSHHVRENKRVYDNC